MSRLKVWMYGQCGFVFLIRNFGSYFLLCLVICNAATAAQWRPLNQPFIFNSETKENKNFIVSSPQICGKYYPNLGDTICYGTRANHGTSGTVRWILNLKTVHNLWAIPGIFKRIATPRPCEQVRCGMISGIMPARLPILPS
ncbi:hypothetical protein [Parapedobacter tibetensis]|uniref:hypothetical protein n=1 Tax=Parapedobacter tibetensis TaxID=2972951 RepID=UPI00214D40B9|nr:hypothetical protein [Parapedobacter tibetensis]